MTFQSFRSFLKLIRGYPYMEILVQGAQSTSGGTGMVYCNLPVSIQRSNSSNITRDQICLIVALTIFATIGLLATSSRMLWAFARENGLPGSGYISRVSYSLSD